MSAEVVLEKQEYLHRGFPGDPVDNTLLPMQGAQVQSLVGELRSHMSLKVAKKRMLGQHS